jgi:anaerobic ribonucleoside-triphosphate reductase
MTDSTFWLRAHVIGLTRTAYETSDRTTAFVAALEEVCPQFQEAFERHLAAQKKLRSEQEAGEIDTSLPLTSQPLGAIQKKFEQES